MKLSVAGKLLTTSSNEEQRILYSELAEKLSAGAEEAIHRGFNRNVQLSAMIGVMTNQEAARAIIRSLRVEVKNVDPQRLSLEAKFEDDLGHLYGGDDNVPDDVAKLLQEIIDTSINDWLRTPEPSKILAEVLNS